MALGAPTNQRPTRMKSSAATVSRCCRWTWTSPWSGHAAVQRSALLARWYPRCPRVGHTRSRRLSSLDVAARLAGQIVILRPNGERLAWPHRMGTCRPTGTRPAVRRRALDFDHLGMAMVDGWRPTDAGMAFGTSSLVSLPVDEEVSGVKPAGLTSLPVDVAVEGPNSSTSKFRRLVTSSLASR